MYKLFVLKALADETRFKIVLKLLEKKMSVLELCKELDKKQPNMSSALAKLATAEIVDVGKSGTMSIYSIKEKEMVENIVKEIKFK